MSQTGNTLFMGRSLYNRKLVTLTGNNHMLTLAGSQSGKGATASIPNLLYWPHSALVIDLKGSHTAVTSRYRGTILGQNVYIADSFHIAVEESDGINPLATLDPEDREIRERIRVITEAFVLPDPMAEKHWDDGARTVIAGLIAQLLTDSRYHHDGPPTLPMLRHLLCKLPDEQKELWVDMSLNERAGGLAKEAAARIIRGIDTDEILGLLSNADKHTEWLSSGPIQEVLSKSTFSFAELKERPTTINLVIPPHYLEDHKRFLRLFINLAINQMSVGGRSKVPVLMILDELLACGYLSEVAKAFGLLAGYNFVCWPFVQDLKSLRYLYPNNVEAFLNNSRAVQVFATSDEETTGFVSKRIGERSMRYVWGVKNSNYAVPLRTPTEVSNEIANETGCQYILRAGRAPLLLEKVRYFEDKLAWKQNAALPDWLMRRRYPFWGKHDPDPDYATAA